jgi:uncharacterized membrane protein
MTYLIPAIILLVIATIAGYYFLNKRKGSEEIVDSTPPSRSSKVVEANKDALKELRNRYARGELTKKQYLQMKEDLED